jgi:hypothetical protein
VASPGAVFSWMTVSSREAQAEINNATAKSEAAYKVKRTIIGTNLIGDTFDASRRKYLAPTHLDEVSDSDLNIEHFSGQLQDKQFSHL